MRRREVSLTPSLDPSSPHLRTLLLLHSFENNR
jgi:hypothetical protein